MQQCRAMVACCKEPCWGEDKRRGDDTGRIGIPPIGSRASILESARWHASLRQMPCPGKRLAIFGIEDHRKEKAGLHHQESSTGSCHVVVQVVISGHTDAGGYSCPTMVCSTQGTCLHL
jgi:hypothetical protein